MATYELWLTDDSGQRMFPLEKYVNFAYTRSSMYLSTLQIQFNFKEWTKMVQPFFRPDWRIEIWRSAAYGYPMRLEDVYKLRKPEIYTRQEDAVQTIMLRGRNGVDLLNRRYVIQYTDTQFTTKTDYIDDMMKEIVREQMLYGSCLDYTGVVDNDRAPGIAEGLAGCGSAGVVPMIAPGPVLVGHTNTRNVAKVAGLTTRLDIHRNWSVISGSQHIA